MSTTNRSKSGRWAAIIALALLLSLSLFPALAGTPVAYAAEGDYKVEGTATGDVQASALNLSTSLANAGAQVNVQASAPDGYYLAQLRYSGNGGTSFTALAANNGRASFTMPAADVQVVADFVPIVWDGSIDITWFTPDAESYVIYYPAQYAGLAALVNGIFPTYPTSPKLDENGQPQVDLKFGTVMLPDYQLYSQAMGVDVSQGVDIDDKTILPSHLYGEFSVSYRLNDSQNSYQRTGPIEKTTRVIGEPSYIRAKSSTGLPHGQFNIVTSDDYWTGEYNFANQTVYIAADLDFGATKVGDVWQTSSPLFMPVSGQYSILPGSGDYTNAYSKLSSSFNGTLDGLGHKFSNVYCEYYANTEYGDAATIGLVGRLGVHDNDPEEIRPVDPTVRQVVLESGYISGRRSTGGIVGKIGKTSKNNNDGSVGGIIEYCINKATVVGTDAKGCAGIVAAGWNGGVVRYCANFGRIDYRYLDPAGGISAYNEVPIYNCYNVGLVTAKSDNFAMGIGTNNGGGRPIVNCYWLSGKSAGGGYYDNGLPTEGVFEFGAGTSIPTLSAELLNSGGSPAQIWFNDSSGINSLDGVNYPVLYFQRSGFDANAIYTVSVQQPSVGGSLTTSSNSARFGTSIRLSATPAAGYILDYFTVNGAQIASDSFALDGHVVVSAVFREQKEATLVIEDTSAKPYTLSVNRAIVDASSERGYQPGEQLQNGDLIYESETLWISATYKDGAIPDDPNLIYSESISVSASFGSQGLRNIASNSPLVFSVTGEYISAALSDDGRLLVRASALTVQKNWEQLADTSWFDASNPASQYTLTSAAQLAGVAALVNDDIHDFAGITLKLGNDISLLNTDGTLGLRHWIPIGLYNTSSFKGVFDGDGHRITGMVVLGNTASSSGLFGNIANATLRNFSINGKVTGNQFSGGAVGQATNSTLSGITNRAALSFKGNYSGGIVGRAFGCVISDCVNAGAVSAQLTTTYQNYVGGIVGEAATGSVIRDCLNWAAVTGGYHVGGIVGNLVASDLERSANSAAVNSALSGSSAGVGGIAGSASGAAMIATVSNLGAVSATGSANATYAGGLVGYANNMDIYDSYNRGKLTASTGPAGGVAGRVAGASSITNVYSTAVVSSTGSSYLGAIAAYVVTNNVAYDNVHYLYTLGLSTNGYAQGGNASAVMATSHTSAEIKTLAPGLGSYFKSDTQNRNAGYPMLTWQPDSRVAAPGSGDLDGDGNLTPADFLTVAKTLTGLVTLSASDQDIADIDGDNQLTAADLVLIIRLATGL